MLYLPPPQKKKLMKKKHFYALILHSNNLDMLFKKYSKIVLKRIHIIGVFNMH